MESIDPDDVILRLLPHQGQGFKGALMTTIMSQNKLRFLAAKRPDALKSHDITGQQERGGTEPLEEYGNPEHTDCLVVRFNQGAKSQAGVTAGRSENADLVIFNIPGISSFHFAFTFDDQYRLILRDLGSTYGTKVTYNGEKGERLSAHDWLLQEPSITKGKAPVLNITDLVQFKVIVPPHDTKSLEYIKKVEQFRMNTANSDDLFASINLQSAPGSLAPTRQHTLLPKSRFSYEE